MNYIIVESQTTDGVTTVLTDTRTDFFDAEAEYHRRLSFAAKSPVDIHSVTLLFENGKESKHEAYDHRTPNAETEE